MSLFSGITFTSSKAKALAAESAAATGQQPPNDVQQPSSSVASNDRDSSLLGSTSSSSSSSNAVTQPKVVSTSKNTASSASLQFAPRLNKPKVSARPPVTVYSAAPTRAAPSSGTVFEAAPVLIVPPPAAHKDQEAVGNGDTKSSTKAPSIMLTDKENDNKRIRGKGDGQKKKKKKKRNQKQFMHTFQPDDDYDPNRPNDLGEYQHYRKQLREERRARMRNQDSDESSYYTDSEDEAPRRDAPKIWAPPKAYSPPKVSSRLPNVPFEEPAHRPPPAPSSAATGEDAYARRLALTQANSGEDAYARRLALSQAATGDDAYARRANMSQPQKPPQSAPAPPPPSTFRPPPANLIAGAPPAFRPPSAQLSAGAPAHPVGGLPPFPPGHPPPQGMQHSMPASRPSDSDYAREIEEKRKAVAALAAKFNQAPAPPKDDSASMREQEEKSSAVPAVTGTFNPVSTSQQNDSDFTRQLEEKKKAAEAIAAKFKMLAGGNTAVPSSQPSEPAPPMEDNTSGSFAERMMRKWGHKEGEGIGKRGDGIVHALATEHVQQPLDPKKPVSKRALAKQKIAAANLKNKKWVQAPNSRGRIINTNEDDRMRAEKERLGEASRIVCLTGLVESVDDVDEDLSNEIGEECSKHGIVERVVLHLLEPPPADPSDGLRVFVVFSGMAGAWRATKELDGRFFGGRKIRVRYFDEARFDAGDRDGDL